MLPKRSAFGLMAFVLTACALTLTAAPSTIIFTDFGTTLDDWGYVVNQAPLGQSFSTSSIAYNLTSVVVILSNNTEEPDLRPFAASRSKHPAARSRSLAPATKAALTPPSCASACTSVALWSDNGGPGPGVELAVSPTVVLDTALPDASSPQQFTFQFASYPLSTNTRYWIMVSSPTNNSVSQWWGTDEPTGAVTSEYTDYSEGVFPVIGKGDFAQQLQVNADPAAPPPTPVPPALTLVLTGLLCIGLYIAFRKRYGLSS
jgi:hypothetical protein